GASARREADGQREQANGDERHERRRNESERRALEAESGHREEPRPLRGHEQRRSEPEDEQSERQRASLEPPLSDGPDQRGREEHERTAEGERPRIHGVALEPSRSSLRGAREERVSHQTSAAMSKSAPSASAPDKSRTLPGPEAPVEMLRDPPSASARGATSLSAALPS